MQLVLEQWATQILSAVPNIVAAILIFVASLYLARLAAAVLVRILKGHSVASNVVSLVSHTLYWTIVLLGLIGALQRFFDVTAFLAGLGLVGFTVAFALQDVMKNFAAGVILLLQQPFRVGEAISVAGFDGTVRAVELRATEMTTFDGRLVSIPNATVLTSPIINYTRASRRRVDFPLQLPAGSDLEATRRIVLDAIRQTPGVVSDPAPTVVLEEISGKVTNLAGSFWIDVTKGNPELARDVALTRINAGLARRASQSPSDGDGHQSD